MSEDHQTRWAGFRSLKFSEDLHNFYRWDVAWNVDNVLKASDRPNVPRLIPVIRLDKNGHPVCQVKDDRKQPRILAAMFVQGRINMLMTAVYDPNYNDPKYRYRLMQYSTDGYGVPQSTDGDHAREDLEDLLEAFTTWVEADKGLAPMSQPLLYAKPIKHTAKPRAKTSIPESYTAVGYGNWA